MTKDENMKDFFKMVEKEIKYAKTKHPLFCDKLVDPSFNWFGRERFYKMINRHSPYYGDMILLEEIAEAFSAYNKGEKAHCLQELAQCCAVIMRMVEYVDNNGKM